MIRKNIKYSLFLIFAILFLDQFTKVLVKMTMSLGDEIHVFGDWFLIHFTENNGMAFGLEFGGEAGKLILTSFRIIALILIGFYIYSLSSKENHKGAIAGLSIVFAGALGNIIDSIFYGVIFSDSYYQVASFLPEGGGYAKLLHGKVVDMFYFPIIEGSFPQWMPIWGGESFLFFSPVFNIADSAITIGVIILIIFQDQLHGEEKKEFAMQVENIAEGESNDTETLKEENL